MKTLKQHILEGILDDVDTTLKKGDYEIDKMVIDEFMKKNYHPMSNWTLSKRKNKDGKYIVSSRSDIRVAQHAKELTNGMFVFGKCRRFMLNNNMYIESLEGGPVEVRDFYAQCSNLKSFKGGPKIISGSCDLDYSTIASLEGMPEVIGTDLYMRHCCNLTSFKGGPKKVGRNVYACECLSLRSIEGAPEYVGSAFDIADCTNLESLEGGPKNVGSFRCNNAHKLNTLNGAPEIVRGSFSCNHCIKLEKLDVPYMEIGANFICDNCTNLKSFKGAPQTIKGTFSANKCLMIKDLVGLPKKIGGSLYVSYCNITSLNGCPAEVGGLIDIHANTPNWTQDDFERLGTKFENCAV